MTDTVVDFTAGVPVLGDLNVRWIHGSLPGGRASEPKFQVHPYDPHTYLLRQSKTVSYEAPFLYLLFGNERALLLDTGARKRPMVRAVVRVAAGCQWRRFPSAALSRRGGRLRWRRVASP
jgi:hypothetical protein